MPARPFPKAGWQCSPHCQDLTLPHHHPAQTAVRQQRRRQNDRIEKKKSSNSAIAQNRLGVLKSLHKVVMAALLRQRQGRGLRGDDGHEAHPDPDPDPDSTLTLTLTLTLP